MEHGAAIDADNVLLSIAKAMAGVDETKIYLSPAPLYHAAPLRWCMAMTRLGATLIVMEKFDPEDFLRQIETHKVTHTQVVPTMFVRLTKLPDEIKKKHICA